MNSINKAIVLADRLGAELAPLTDKTCAAMLPVAGKPLMQHVIEQLADAGIKDVFIISSAWPEQVETHLGDGTRFGMRIRYGLSRGEEPADILVRRSGGFASDPCLIVRGDVLASFDVAGFTKRAMEHSEPVVLGVHNDHAVVALRRSAGPGLAALNCTAPAVESVTAQTGLIQLDSVNVAWVNDLRGYHAANIDVAAGRFPSLVTPGRAVAVGLTACRGSRINPASLERGIAFIGPGARVHADARLEGEIVIGEGAMIDRGARVRDSVVMPWTYVGEMLSVKNAVVRSTELIRIDTGAVLPIEDNFLLADLRRTPAAVKIAELFHRLLGCLLFMVSLPLWLVGLFAALIESPKAPMRVRILRGNRSTRLGRRTFRQWRFATSVPLLQGLPGLLNVALGDLRLIGCSPLSPERASMRRCEWEFAGDRAPAGLIAPATLELSFNASWDERLLRDALYANIRTPAEDLRLAAKAVAKLFSFSSWRPAKCP